MSISSSGFVWSGCFVLALSVAGLSMSDDAPVESSRAAQPSVADEKPLQVGRIRCGRILYLGNSITLHGPAPKIGWTGNWGMAATAEEKDYVHLLTKRIAEAAGGEPKIRVRNIADFERGFAQYDVAAGLKEELAFHPELVVLAIGENVSPLQEDASRAGFRKAVTGLLKAVKEVGSAAGEPTVIVRSSFWADPVKDGILKEVAKEAGAVFVDIHELGADPSMAASSEQKIEHDGVAAHPGDKGMQAIADAIWKAIDGSRVQTP
jgi:lysophospholipase L1-like esterase